MHPPSCYNTLCQWGLLALDCIMDRLKCHCYCLWSDDSWVKQATLSCLVFRTNSSGHAHVPELKMTEFMHIQGPVGSLCGDMGRETAGTMSGFHRSILVSSTNQAMTEKTRSALLTFHSHSTPHVLPTMWLGLAIYNSRGGRFKSHPLQVSCNLATRWGGGCIWLGHSFQMDTQFYRIGHKTPNYFKCQLIYCTPLCSVGGKCVQWGKGNQARREGASWINTGENWPLPQQGLHTT